MDLAKAHPRDSGTAARHPVSPRTARDDEGCPSNALTVALACPYFERGEQIGMAGVTGEAPDFEALSGKVNQMLSAFGTARLRRGLTADEVLIFLAAGQLSIMPEDQAQTAKPVTYVAISYLLNIPKRRCAGKRYT